MLLGRLFRSVRLIRKHPCCGHFFRQSLSTQINSTAPMPSSPHSDGNSHPIFSPITSVQESFHLKPNASERLQLQGWIVSTVKLKKHVGFFHLTDGLSNHKIQVVLSKEAIDRSVCSVQAQKTVFKILFLSTVFRRLSTMVRMSSVPE